MSFLRGTAKCNRFGNMDLSAKISRYGVRLAMFIAILFVTFPGGFF